MKARGLMRTLSILPLFSVVPSTAQHQQEEVLCTVNVKSDRPYPLLDFASGMAERMVLPGTEVRILGCVSAPGWRETYVQLFDVGERVCFWEVGVGEKAALDPLAPAPLMEEYAFFDNLSAECREAMNPRSIECGCGEIVKQYLDPELRVRVFGGAVVFDAPSPFSNRLVEIGTGGDYVHLLGYEANGFWKVTLGETTGYLNEANIVKGDPLIDKAVAALAVEAKRAEQKARDAALKRAEERAAARAAQRQEEQAAALASGEELTVVDVDSRVTERNEVWWRYAWTLTLRNNTKSAKAVRATIEWTDSDGHIIDDDTADGLSLGPQAEATFMGYTLINAFVAPDIQSVGAEIAWK